MVWYGLVWCDVVWYGLVWCGVVCGMVCGTVWYGMVGFYVIWYGLLWFCVLFYGPQLPWGGYTTPVMVWGDVDVACDIMWYFFMVLSGVVWYGVVWCVWYRIMRYGVVWGVVPQPIGVNESDLSMISLGWYFCIHTVSVSLGWDIVWHGVVCGMVLHGMVLHGT